MMQKRPPPEPGVAVANDTLDLPPYPFKTRSVEARAEIFDEVRRKWVRLTPEEWVRQHVAMMLVAHHGVKKGRLAIEKGFLFLGQPRRADLVVYDVHGQAQLLVECKAPGVKIGQETFEQVARYNQVLGSRTIMVTNGLQHFVYRVEGTSFTFLPALPTL